MVNVVITDSWYTSVEVISRLITTSRYLERQYLKGTKSDDESPLKEALIRLCADILAYLARMVMILEQKGTGKADG